MKTELITFFFILITVFFYGQTRGYDRMRKSQLILKNGDTIHAKGKLKSKVFKYKRYNKEKPIEISYSEVKRIKIWIEEDFTPIFVPFLVRGTGKIIPVQELVIGKKVSLYGITNSFTSQGAGGIRFQQTSTTYYFKKPHHKEVIKLGAYRPLSKKLKNNIKIVFKDCDLLLKKIANKEFRIRDGLSPMFNFYNTECQ